MNTPARVRAALTACLAILLVLPACATNPVTGRQDFVLMSEQQEIELGREYHKQVLKQYDVYDDPALQDYVSKIGQELARRSHRPNIEYTFTVLDSPEVNAFALPGGYIYITRGILAYFNSEAEMAGVLGHELGHVTARHSVRQYSAATASSLLGGILLSATDAGSAAGDLFQTVQLAAMRGYGREQELEADRLGAQYLARDGYDPQEMMDVIRILADQEDYERQRAKAEGREPNVYHGVFASHPENDARLQEVIRAADKYAANDPKPAGHDVYLRHVDGLTYGPGASQGVVIKRQFLHLGLDAALDAPKGWTIDNQPQRILFQAPNGAALLQVTLGEAGKAQDPRALLQRRIGSADLERGRALTVAGHPGYTGVAEGRTSAGPRPLRHTVVVYDGRAWYFAATTRDRNDFDRYDEDFLDIARSLAPLTAAQRQAARPLQLKIVEAGGDTRYERLGKGLDRLEDGPAQLRLLNGDWPDGEPKAGRLIKTLVR